ncbi:hypothetical protein [Sphingomonas corticis]|uniref:Uncharacterized protein n=1 Tax=Sphingomonas corticis TaxID=2722791 RepID=A0ABX1CX26_9SPHN|nr:hypothetical protein [Sphingomonas corticis]NJR80525.1 hypothetical protein [Sphingomonas corticis]
MIRKRSTNVSADATTRNVTECARVVAGIGERVLPDGLVVFRAAPDDEIGTRALAALCKGKGVWNPVFATWICPAMMAGEIRAALPDAVRLGQLP